MEITEESSVNVEMQSSGSLPLLDSVLPSPSSLVQQENQNPNNNNNQLSQQEEQVSRTSLITGALEKAGGFMPMPYFAGPSHGIEWQPISRKNGEMQSPLSIESGLSAVSLTDPGGLTTYIDPALEPKTDEEWLVLYKQAFDDLEDVDVTQAKAAVEHRVTLERMLIRKEATKVYFRPRYTDEKNRDRVIRFQFRYGNDTYALATCVTCTDKTDAIYDSISNDSTDHELLNLDTDMLREVEQLKTVKECDKLLRAIHTLKASYEASLPDRAAFLKRANVWLELCIAKTTEINRLEAEPVGSEAETEDENDSDEEGVHIKTTTTEEKGKMRPSHSVGWVTYPFNKGDPLPLDKDRPIPEPNPLFSPYKLRELGTAKEIKGKPSGKTRFDWITDHVLHGQLFCINTLPTSGTNSEWRGLKTKLRIPCAFDGGEKEVLIVDHERAYILAMPSGLPTGEEYLIAPKRGDPTNFKMVSCSLSYRYVLIMGYRRGSDVANIVVIRRAATDSATLTMFDTNVPLASAILSKTHPDTMLLGFSEGTILRVRIPPTNEKKKHGKQMVNVFPPVHPASMADGEERNKEVLYAIQTEIRTQRKRCGARAIVESFASSVGEGVYADWCMHVGNANPVTRIVEHGKRLVASTRIGLVLFKMDGLTMDVEDRRTLMKLRHNASYDFRGNLLVIHKSNNAMQIVHLHTYKLEVTLDPPTVLTPQPPDMTLEVSSISLHDQVIIILHGDGTRRVVELDSKFAPTPIPPPTVSIATTGGKEKKKNGKKK